MHSRLRIHCLLLPAVLGLAQCNKSAVSEAGAAASTVPGLALVKEGVSPHFHAVASKLEVGGSSFSYAEEGEIMSLLGSLVEEVMKSMPEAEKAKLPPNFSFKKVFGLVGLDSIKASGMSSRKLPNGLNHQRSFVYTPEGRQGLLTLSGGPAEPLLVPLLAAKDTDLAFEFPIHLKDWFAQAWPLVMEYAPTEQRQMIEAMASAPQPALGISYREMAEKLSLRLAVIATLMPEQSMPLPGAAGTPMSFPGVNAAIVIDKLSWLRDLLKQQMLPMLMQKDGPFEMTSTGKVTAGHFRGPMGPPPMDFQPAFHLDDEADRLIIATRPGYLATLLAKEDRLHTQPEFAKVWGMLPNQGNGCVFISQRLMETVVDGVKTAVAATGSAEDSATALGIIELLGKYARSPQAMVFANLPDGIFTASTTSLPTASPASISSMTTMAMLSGLAAPMMSSIQQQGVQMKGTSDGLTVLTALKLHAANNGGKYPEELAQLVSGGALEKPELLMPAGDPGAEPALWLYDNSLTPDSPGISIVLAAPFTKVSGGKETRLVIRNDGRVENIAEADFQRTKDYNLQ
ncbi:MAG: hypothetical protein ACO1TE_12895 [Prosthecobacter sp.]